MNLIINEVAARRPIEATKKPQPYGKIYIISGTHLKCKKTINTKKYIYIIDIAGNWFSRIILMS